MAKRLAYKGSLDGSGPIYKEINVNNTQTIKKGYVLQLSTNKASLAADAQAAGTVLGPAAGAITTTTATTADKIKYDSNPNSIYSMPYIGSATPAIGNKYDLGATADEFDADDTTGGWIQVVGNVDTTNKRADVILTSRVFGA